MTVTWTGFSGLLNSTPNANPLTDTLKTGTNPLNNQTGRLMYQSSMRRVRKLFDVMVNSGTGNLAQETYPQVASVPFTPMGGVVTIATKYRVNETTGAATKTELNAITRQTFGPASYPTDASGNGGGGKLGR